MTPFFKIRESHRDNSVIWRYKPRLNVLKLWTSKQVVPHYPAFFSESNSFETALLLSHSLSLTHMISLKLTKEVILYSEWNKALNSLFCELVCTCVFCVFVISYLDDFIFSCFNSIYIFFVASWSFLMSRKVKHVKWNNHIRCFKPVVRVNPPLLKQQE